MKRNWWINKSERAACKTALIELRLQRSPLWAISSAPPPAELSGQGRWRGADSWLSLFQKWEVTAGQQEGKQTAGRTRELPEKAEVMKGEEEEVGKTRGKSRYRCTPMGLGSVPRCRNLTETIVFPSSASDVNHVTIFFYNIASSLVYSHLFSDGFSHRMLVSTSRMHLQASLRMIILHFKCNPPHL